MLVRKRFHDLKSLHCKAAFVERERLEQPDSSEYIQETKLLNYRDASITHLLETRGWNSIQDESVLIGSIYAFVRDEIAYGYTKSFELSSSQILHKGYGNCITKTILLMGLFRAVGIPCRFHAFTVNKILFRGLVKGLRYNMISETIHHSWVEIFHEGSWIEIEGHIIDRPYLKNLQAKFPDYMGSFYGYGLAVLNFKNPPIQWNDEHTYVQNKVIEKDLGRYESPDAFFREFPEAESCSKGFRYRHFIRPSLNKNIIAIRSGK